jgi:2-desacetyl-2-hydroxyethyl bacteriochlorophyllide A dehydrogenase
VRIAVERCGICGSDLHWFQGRHPTPQVCPGHEISGVVEALGRDTAGWREGDRVAVEPLERCGACPLCLRGDYHLCPRLQIAGVTTAGGMATALVVPSYCLFALPHNVDFELGALAEPTAVVVHALRLAEVGRASRVLVLGAGTIGLLAVAAARHLGAASVAVTARYDHQRALALRLGCDHALADDASAVPEPPDVVIETVGGNAGTVGEGMDVIARGGTIVVVGLFERPIALPPLALLVKETRIVGSMVYNRRAGRSDFELALEILSEQASPLRNLITHVLPLTDAQRAFSIAGDKRTGAVKVLLDTRASA